eukprot:s1459_g8.t1
MDEMDTLDSDAIPQPSSASRPEVPTPTPETTTTESISDKAKIDTKVEETTETPETKTDKATIDTTETPETKTDKATIDTTTEIGFGDDKPINLKTPTQTQTESKFVQTLVDMVQKDSRFEQFCQKSNIQPFANSDPVQRFSELVHFDSFLLATGSTPLDKTLMNSAKGDLYETAVQNLTDIAEGCRSSAIWKHYIQMMAAKEDITITEEVDEFKQAWCNVEAPLADQCRHLQDYLSYLTQSGNDHCYNLDVLMEIMNIDLTQTEPLFASDSVPVIETETENKNTDIDMANQPKDAMMDESGDVAVRHGEDESDETEGESDLHFRFPPPPSVDHPSIKCILGSAAKASSVSTFKCSAAAIRFLRPAWFLLENVDLEGDDSEGNLRSILRVLEAAEYLVQTFRLVATDFGLPQRRVRIYLVGFCQKRHPDISFQRMERHISMMRLKCQSPDACLSSALQLLL